MAKDWQERIYDEEDCIRADYTRNLTVCPDCGNTEGIFQGEVWMECPECGARFTDEDLKE